MASSLTSNDFQEGVDDEDAGRGLVSDENALQKHVAFFDRNNDGIIYPWETFQGFRAIGAGYLLSFISAFLINLGLSRKTRPVCVVEVRRNLRQIRSHSFGCLNIP
ncbi:hypothetical protein E1A91_A12G164800v1 [Gossypium mustelinum]|uniref:EF-hand domain-containing protein n=1 Tax=Gossypium mustelinum TaxID=34275 RepID=A0A5D2WV65_GOSMU|nr:hypothetical protein E1A91_A12G164800v1 [Gossypium mustelinum]